MDDQQTIRLECLQLAMKLGHQRPNLDILSAAKTWADWVGGEQSATIHVHASAADPEALVDAIRSHTTCEPLLKGYVIRRDIRGWYFVATAERNAPLVRARWPTEAEAIKHAEARETLAEAWEPEDPQMGELAHPKPTIAEVADRLDQADIDFDMRVAATIRRLNRFGISL
jgi:hypothetical protein